MTGLPAEEYAEDGCLRKCRKNGVFAMRKDMQASSYAAAAGRMVMLVFIGGMLLGLFQRMVV